MSSKRWNSRVNRPEWDRNRWPPAPPCESQEPADHEAAKASGGDTPVGDIGGEVIGAEGRQPTLEVAATRELRVPRVVAIKLEPTPKAAQVGRPTNGRIVAVERETNLPLGQIAVGGGRRSAPLIPAPLRAQTP
jgi:hypothetical protein